MVYSEGFLSALIYISLFCLVPVFIFQIFYFVKDIKNKTFWNK